MLRHKSRICYSLFLDTQYNKKMKINTDYVALHSNNRPEGYTIDAIVLHHTALNNAIDVLEFFSKKESRVSAHFLISRNGEIYRVVDVKKRAWHAGYSYWKHHKHGLNDNSIGIELDNNGFEKFTEIQMNNLIALLKKLKEEHDIKDDMIIGHSDIAPGRKKDPSAFFDWNFLHKNGIKYFPDVDVKDSNKILCKNGDNSDIVKEMQSILNKLGYGAFPYQDNAPYTILDNHFPIAIKENGMFDIGTMRAVQAFNRHYCNDLFPKNHNDKEQDIYNSNPLSPCNLWTNEAQYKALQIIRYNENKEA